MTYKPLLLSSALLAFAAVSASADPLSIASYGSTATAPTGVSNTATIYASGPTYNLTSDNIWTSAVGNSSWVGINPNDNPDGGHEEPDGTYTYSTTFVLGTDAASLTGELTVMADDTTSVLLNGVQILAAAPANGAPYCTQTVPNCTTPVTISLSDFLVGTNTLSFGVNQDFEHATGLDFAGTIGATPEPSSLLLLGSGLSAVAGFAARRRRS